jgi:hypothetical protein
VNLGAVLIALGIIFALLIHWTLGVLLIIVGAVLILAPAMR